LEFSETSIKLHVYGWQRNVFFFIPALKQWVYITPHAGKHSLAEDNVLGNVSGAIASWPVNQSPASGQPHLTCNLLARTGQEQVHLSQKGTQWAVGPVGGWVIGCFGVWWEVEWNECGSACCGIWEIGFAVFQLNAHWNGFHAIRTECCLANQRYHGNSLTHFVWQKKKRN